jgi:hypothetical protein
MATFPIVKFQGQAFPVEQILDKTLYSIARNNVRRTPYIQDDNILFVSSPGQLVGVVFSWVVKENYLWWMLTDPKDKTKSQWVRHSDTQFSLNALKQQGSKTTKEVEKEKKAEEDKDKTWSQRIAEMFGTTASTINKILPPVIVIGSGILLWKLAGSPPLFKRKSKK